MARIGWRWEDPVAGTIQIMPINPNKGASPKYEKTLSKKTTTGNGRVLVMEGADAPQQFDFSGAILTQAHYEFLYNAWAKRHPVSVTDDLGRTFVLYIESFSPERDPKPSHPWKHTYSATAVIVG